MKRDKLEELLSWKHSKFRKPLIVRGARQTGKTWLLKEFGESAFKKTVYVNFEEDRAGADLPSAPFRYGICNSMIQ